MKGYLVTFTSVDYPSATPIRIAVHAKSPTVALSIATERWGTDGYDLRVEELRYIMSEHPGVQAILESK